ncbi:MAG: hypothetical protein DMG30_24495 [Acidobacteria bacterium]|nr:MAG: hypothetical protein DMG30_24495 [Acidobacteriota bacterium]
MVILLQKRTARGACQRRDEQQRQREDVSIRGAQEYLKTLESHYGQATAGLAELGDDVGIESSFGKSGGCWFAFSAGHDCRGTFSTAPTISAGAGIRLIAGISSGTRPTSSPVTMSTAFRPASLNWISSPGLTVAAISLSSRSTKAEL